MINEISHLLNTDTSKLIIICGIPGAGKSTIVSEFEKVGYEVVCPDRIRFELAKKQKGNEELSESELNDKNMLQKYSVVAFKISDERIKKALNNGKSVIFDAMNLNPKSRKAIINCGLVNKVPVIAIYIDCPLELALDRNIKRSQTVIEEKDGKLIYGRYVPSSVIELKYKNQILPTKEEGFSEIYIHHVDDDILILDDAKKKLNNLYALVHNSETGNELEEILNKWEEEDLLRIIIPSFARCWNIDQENENHKYPLHKHMIEVAKELRKEDFTTFIAGLLHDIGKMDTKCKHGRIIADTELFKAKEKVEVKIGENGFVSARILDSKGERNELLTIKHVDIDENTHYYNHQQIGALKARRELSYLGYDNTVLDTVYNIILHHMDLPFINAMNEKTAKRLYKNNGNMLEILIKHLNADCLAKGNSATNELQHIQAVYKNNMFMLDLIKKNKGDK